MEALAIPGLHTVGLLLCMSMPLDESGTQTNNAQTSPPDQKAPRIVSRLHTLENESKICHQAFPPGKHFAIPPLPNITAVNVLGDFSIARDRLAIIDGEGASAYFAPQFRIFAVFPIRISSVHAHAHNTLFHHLSPFCSPLLTVFVFPIPPTIRYSPVSVYVFRSYYLILHSTRHVSHDTDHFCTADPWRPMTPHSDYYAQDRSDTIPQPFKIIPGMSLFCR